MIVRSLRYIQSIINKLTQLLASCYLLTRHVAILATSNAPNTRRKRRISSTEREAADEDQEQARKKKIRGDSESENLASDDPVVTSTAETNSAAAVTAGADGDEEEVTVQREGSLEVKVVTKGVKGVELDDSGPSTAEAAITDPQSEAGTSTTDAETESGVEPAVEGDAVVHPESIPLPDEEAGELDELRSSSPAPQEDPTPSTNTTTEEPAEASHDAVTETPAESPSPERRRRTRGTASPRKLRSKSPKKVSARA